MQRKLDIRDVVADGIRPDRAAENLTVADCRAGGGYTDFHKGKAVRIAAPLASGAKARTIRIHEQLHANNTSPRFPKKVHPVALNAIEDARVHGVYWPNSMPRQANRDCLAVGLADLRELPPMAALGRADDWNNALLYSFRSLAIIRRLNGCSKRSYRVNRFVSDRLLRAFGPAITEELVNILGTVRTRRAKAMARFQALLRTEEPKDNNGTRKGNKSSGAASASPMRIVRLPLVETCNSAVRRTNLARSGARLNRPRLARAIASGSTSGLFVRQRYLPGGTYLFDASGSMQLSESALEQLCRSVPAATVAYYSGWNSGAAADGAYGELVIYAENQRRAETCQNVHGCNAVDLFALQWLLRQPAPRVFVCDGGFCDGPEGQDIAAAKLAASAVANGQLIWHKSIADLQSALR